MALVLEPIKAGAILKIKENSIRVEYVSQNEKYIYVIVYFRDEDYYWHQIKLKIPKRRLEKL
jgi:hypothetical protein